MARRGITESQIEHSFKGMVSEGGGWCIKFPPIFLAGFPDRMVLLPGGRIIFVELKKPTTTLRRLQEIRRDRLQALGFICLRIRTFEEIEDFKKTYINGDL